MVNDYGDLRAEGLRVTVEVRPLDTIDAPWMPDDVIQLQQAISDAISAAIPAGDLVLSVRVSRMVR
jgi:hypothetical protein